MAATTGTFAMAMNVATEQILATLNAVALGTLVQNIFINGAGATIDPVVRVYKNYVQVGGGVSITAGTMEDFFKSRTPLLTAEQAVVKLSCIGLGAASVNIPYEIATLSPMDDFNTTKKTSIQTASDAATTANAKVLAIIATQTAMKGSGWSANDTLQNIKANTDSNKSSIGK